MDSVNITFRAEKGIKMEAEKAFKEMGLNMTTGLNIYLTMVAQEKKIPFVVRAKSQAQQRQMKRKNQLAYTSTKQEKQAAVEKLEGILSGYEVDLDAMREERILSE
jgi:DNA-damage-inducible protein J